MENRLEYEKAFWNKKRGHRPLPKDRVAKASREWNWNKGTVPYDPMAAKNQTMVTIIEPTRRLTLPVVDAVLKYQRFLRG